MVLEERLNYGISLMAQYGMNHTMSFNIMKRSGLLPALYYMISLGIYSQDIHAEDINDYSYLSGFSKDQLNYSYYSAGIGKGFYFLRNFECIPSLSVGLEQTSINKVSYSTLGLYPEVLLGYRISPAFQIFSRFHYNLYIGNTAVQDENNEQTTGKSWDKAFPREIINISGGLRFSF